MNFVLEHIGKAGERAGHLELKSKVFATPFPLLRTKGGAIPNLTRETLEYLNLPETAVLIPYQYHATQTDVLQQFKKGIGHFLGLSSSATVITIEDPGEESRTGYHGNKNISVWNNCNREVVDPRRYLEFLSAAKPDLALALCDGDTPQDATKKRINKAVKKSLEFLDTCLELKDEYENLASCSWMGGVQGGLESAARQYSVKETTKRPLQGYLVDGFHRNGSKTETLSWETIQPTFTETTGALPKDKPRFYFGAARPDLVFKLIATGIDVFDTSYPNLVTERESALVFPNKFKPNVAPEEKLDKPTEFRFEVSLRDESFRLAMTPLVPGCDCYTCRNFTCAYLHHLVLVKEMLAKVLLELHNLHHYHTFFSQMRKAIVCDELDNFRRTVLQ